MQYQNSLIDICLEHPASVLKGLTQKEKETIAESQTSVSFRKGESIYNEGDKTRGLACLASGKVKLFRVGVGGREQILRMAKPGDILGLSLLFTDNIWHESATAIEDSSICIIDKNSLAKLVKKNPDLLFRISKQLAEEMHASNNRIVSLTQKHVRGRIAESLLSLRDIYGFDGDSKTLSITISREDIAHFSNMTTSNAIRTLSNMASEGILELRGKRILILDQKILEHISETG